MHQTVTLQVVSWNSEKYISSCIESLQNQVIPKSRVIIHVIDNASTDNTLKILESLGDSIQLTKLTKNLGFTGAHNLGISNALQAGSDYICLINPDLYLNSDTIQELILATQAGPRIGASTPLLLRNKELSIEKNTCDACGMDLFSNMRHLDRGSNLPISDDYLLPRYVFGGTGACLLLTKEAILDTSYPSSIFTDLGEDQFFDPRFFAYREDAEASFRLQLRGWRVRYEPKAVGYHVRQVTPENRSEVDPRINGLSVKNRFLIQLNCAPLLFLTLILPRWFLRNILVIIACILKEQSSLPYLGHIFKELSEILQKRKYNLSRRQISSLDLSSIIEGENRSQENALIASQTSNKKISSIHLVVICYHSETELSENIESIFKTLSEIKKSKLTLVNNSESTQFSLPLNHSIQICAKNYPSVSLEIIDDKYNYGFAGGANKALLHTDYDLYAILNSDVNLSDFSLKTILNLFEKYENLGVVSPLIKSKESNEIQFQYQALRLPRFRDLIFDFLKPLSSPIKHLLNTHRTYESSPLLTNFINTPTHDLLEVEQASGAALFIRARAFNSLLGLDQRFSPAWYEDVDFSKRLLASKWVVGITNQTQVFHLGGESLETIGNNSFLTLFYLNKLRYYRKHQAGEFKKFIAILLIFLEFTLKRLSLLKSSNRTETLGGEVSNLRNDFKTLLRM